MFSPELECGIAMARICTTECMEEGWSFSPKCEQLRSPKIAFFWGTHLDSILNNIRVIRKVIPSFLEFATQ